MLMLGLLDQTLGCADSKCPSCDPISLLPCFMLIPCDGTESFVSNNSDFETLLNTFVSVDSVLYTGTVYVILLTDNTCSEAIEVIITEVPVDDCPLTCYYVQQSNGVLYVDSNDDLQEISLTNAQPYVKICSKTYPVVDTSSLDYLIVDLGLCDENDCPQQCYKLVNCENGTTIYTNSDSVLPYLYGTNTFVQVSGQEGCWEVLPLSEKELCDCPIDVIITSSYIDCITCTGYTSYKLTNCNGTDVIYTLDDLSAYLSSTIKIHCGCYTLEQLDILPPNPQSIAVENTFGTCLECLRPYWELTDCLGVAENIYTYTDVSAYVGKVIKVEGCETCWEVELTEFPINPITVNVTFEFEDCPTCYIDIPCLCQTAKLISQCFNYNIAVPVLFEGALTYTKCDGEIISLVAPLNQEKFIITFCGPQNQVFDLPYTVNLDINCNRLSWIDCDGNVITSDESMLLNEVSPKICVKKWLAPEGQYEYTVYGECKYGVCPPPVFKNNRTVRPGYNTPICRPEKYDMITCHFADMLYKIALEKRYGITNCCPEEDDKWLVQKELIDLQALKDPNYICPDCPCSCNSGKTHSTCNCGI